MLGRVRGCYKFEVSSSYFKAVVNTSNSMRLLSTNSKPTTHLITIYIEKFRIDSRSRDQRKEKNIIQICSGMVIRRKTNNGKPEGVAVKRWLGKKAARCRVRAQYKKPPQINQSKRTSQSVKAKHQEFPGKERGLNTKGSAVAVASPLYPHRHLHSPKPSPPPPKSSPRRRSPLPSMLAPREGGEARPATPGSGRAGLL